MPTISIKLLSITKVRPNGIRLAWLQSSFFFQLHYDFFQKLGPASDTPIRSKTPNVPRITSPVFTSPRKATSPGFTSSGYTNGSSSNNNNNNNINNNLYSYLIKPSAVRPSHKYVKRVLGILEPKHSEVPNIRRKKADVKST